MSNARSGESSPTVNPMKNPNAWKNPDAGLNLNAGWNFNQNPNAGWNFNQNPNVGWNPNQNPNVGWNPNQNPNVGWNPNQNPNAGWNPNPNPNVRDVALGANHHPRSQWGNDPTTPESEIDTAIMIPPDVALVKSFLTQREPINSRLTVDTSQLPGGSFQGDEEKMDPQYSPSMSLK